MNGKPGDHPLTDILSHKIEVYGREADELIRKIGDLCSRRELDEWWEREIGWLQDRELALRERDTTSYLHEPERAVGRHHDDAA